MTTKDLHQPLRLAYLHGFASSPLATKGVELGRRLGARGLTLHRPDLNRPSFSELTYTEALEAIDALDRDHGAKARWLFVGSSMGGYLASRWAQLHPNRVDRLLLLCPAFDLLGRWPALVGQENMARWEREGWLPMEDARKQLTPVHFGLVEDAQRHPRIPEIPCPSVIIHGSRDEVVPIETSRRYAQAFPERVLRLLEVDDDHSLSASLDVIERELLALLV